MSEHDQYSRSSKEAVLKFYDVLKKNGINCVIRKEHGTDIDAACGQLRSKQMKKKKSKTNNVVKIGSERFLLIRFFVYLIKIVGFSILAYKQKMNALKLL